jgi:glycosyltransferase involved in cell wall biosynthesis
VRQALPHLARLGWEVEILATTPESGDVCLDPYLEHTVPLGIPIHRVALSRPAWHRDFGSGALASRAWPNLCAAGDALLASGRFDLVFLSTTQFGLFLLGPRWQRRYGTPYVLDFQDEWVTDYYTKRATTPPGGWWKYLLRQTQARWQEKAVVGSAAGVVAVSPRYVNNLRRRYPRLSLANTEIIPFGVCLSDFEAVTRWNVVQSIFDPKLGRSWVHVGRGGADLAIAAQALFSAIRLALDSGTWPADGLQLHFIGTSYAPRDRAKPSLAHLAAVHGLDDLVREHPARLGYFPALRCLADADALLLLGSDDPGYTPSKLAPYLGAGKPILAILHEDCPAVPDLRDCPGVTLITFRDAAGHAARARQIAREWIAPGPRVTSRARHQAHLARHATAPLAARLTALFDQAIAIEGGRS